MTFRGPSLPTIDVNEADRRLGSDDPAPLLLDVRERDEFATGRAPGAVLLPTSSFLVRFEALPRDRPILVICQSGSRSSAVSAFLARNGWTDVTNVAGGMDAWARAGLRLRRGPLAAGEGELEG